MTPQDNHRRILGVDFYAGDVQGAINQMARGGLLVVPAAPALLELDRDAQYREALLNADLVIPDSALMVMVWNLLEHDSLQRISGLTYLRDLLRIPEFLRSGNTLWIMASPASAETNLQWLHSNGIQVPESCVYIAPMYGGEISDPLLLERINELRPQHVVVTVGGGVQERLGYYLKRRLNYLPSIHCIGAAIAFLSGDQVRIPTWADRFYLGWLFRCISAPGRFVPRYWRARMLLPMLIEYRDRLPVPAPAVSEKSREAA